jgi:hypothetical protein
MLYVRQFLFLQWVGTGTLIYPLSIDIVLNYGRVTMKNISMIYVITLWHPHSLSFSINHYIYCHREPLNPLRILDTRIWRNTIPILGSLGALLPCIYYQNMSQTD